MTKAESCCSGGLVGPDQHKEESCPLARTPTLEWYLREKEIFIL